MPSLGEYLRRGYDYLSGIFGRRTREEEEEEEDVSEAELPEGAEQAFEGALGAGDMATGAPIPSYTKVPVKTPTGFEEVRFTSKTEDIRSSIDYITIIKPDLQYRCGAIYYLIDEEVPIEGMFTGDPSAFLPHKEEFSAPNSYVWGTIIIRIHLKDEYGHPGRIVMQKEIKYHRWTPA